MHTARIPPADPAPASITVVLAMHTGHICPSSELLIRPPLSALPGVVIAFFSPCTVVACSLWAPGEHRCTWAALHKIRRALRRESCELAFERLGYAGVPARRDCLGRGVGKDVLVAVFQTIEDALRRRLG